MNLNDIKYNFIEWVKLNIAFFNRVQKNYHFQKKKNITFNNNFLDDLSKNYSPIFILSTGRCGTEYISKILALSEQVDVYHSPHPELIIASKFAYENIDTKHDIIKSIVESARIELIMESYSRNRFFIETNNKITFFAYALADIFPNSKFIHLVRHPGSFVRSGIRRNWYKNSDKQDLGRIIPHDEKIDFNRFNDIQKISWLWEETNLFIENFKTKIDDDNRVLTIRAEDLFGNRTTINSIYDFIGCEYPKNKKIDPVLNKKINVQKNEDFPKYSDWSKNDKEFLINICSSAEKYDYRLL